MACLKTLVPCYKANDPHTAGPIDAYYAEALPADYAVSYDKFHKKLAKALHSWYEQFQAVLVETEQDDSEDTDGNEAGI